MIRDSLLPEFDHEMATTRRVLERVPDAQFAWKPHEKSMALGALATHVATIVWWGQVTLETNGIDLGTMGDDVRPKPPSSSAELINQFDANVKKTRERLAQIGDPEMMQPWTLKNNGHTIFTLPKISALRSFVMNHLIHHRGQLSVYLRLNNVPLPSIYGPTADEQ
jgi:uncharacterized damage-inducible protein DinB